MAPPPSAGQAFMDVVVPRGCKAGSTFTVKTPDGQWMQVTVPAGCKPKQKLVMAYEPLSNSKSAAGGGKERDAAKGDGGGAKTSASASEAQKRYLA